MILEEMVTRKIPAQKTQKAVCQLEGFLNSSCGIPFPLIHFRGKMKVSALKTNVSITWSITLIVQKRFQLKKLFLQPVKTYLPFLLKNFGVGFLTQSWSVFTRKSKSKKPQGYSQSCEQSFQNLLVWIILVILQLSSRFLYCTHKFQEFIVRKRCTLK